ncbi:MAG: lipid IV(A) 3-deoxy-D-manno-octulosonic acid transferase [Gallionellaceae bacterium]|jgi:3-deoxy-D-manno-octulosonic-acid transferase|nr:lipid IV(A) 3-deoxy-D-manno-octulosonic acid transferase [Gallionellaceae bacterium]
MTRLFDFRFVYRALLWLSLPYVLFHLLWRARKQPAYLRHIGERFGFYAPVDDKPVIWLHTVSVGETRAAASLVQALRARWPDHRILLTHTTPTGRATSEQLYGDDVTRVYLPYDYPFAVRRFLRRFQPKVGVLLETEIWPNLIRACCAASVPLLLLNARLSERSARRYARFPSLTRVSLQELHLIVAQTEADAARLAQLGKRDVPVMGNLKFDVAPTSALLETGALLRAQFGGARPIFLAASTREGEEALLLDALKQARTARLLTVIGPRHPQRFDEVAALVTQHGFTLQRRSANQPVSADTQVVLGDSMGEMVAYYAACDVAFIGGSLLPLGGQNLIEACAVGKPVLIGAHTWNFTQAAHAAVTAGAAIRIKDGAQLVQEVDLLLADVTRREAMGAAGQRFVSENQGATQRAVDCIESALRP